MGWRVSEMPTGGSRVVLTVGHSTHSMPEFLALLRRGLVGAIADVRRYPGSKRSPHFGVVALKASLAAADVGYVGFSASLGGRRRRDRSGGAGDGVDNSAWRSASFRAYADHMGTTEFECGINRLESLAAEQRTAVMCAEVHPSRCHRRLIADALTARGWRVFHLLPGQRTPALHELSPHAVVIGDRVSYPAPTDAGSDRHGAEQGRGHRSKMGGDAHG